MNPRNFLQSEFRKKTNEDKSPENGISFIDNDMIMNILGEQEFNKGFQNPNRTDLNNFRFDNNFDHQNNFNQELHGNFIYGDNNPFINYHYLIPNSNLNENRNLSLDKKGLKIENFIKNDRKNSVDNNNDDISKYKNQGKNTYSEKISKLMNKETKIKIEANKTNNLMNSSALSSKSYEYLQNKNSSDEKEEEVEKLNKKLEKNRESARNSRKRKKIYIQLLENKVSELTQDLESTKKLLENNSQQLSKISHHSRFINNIVKGKQQIFEKLEKFNQSSSAPEDQELNLLVDSLRLRLGATGKERVTAINFLFKQIFNLILPAYIKFLLWSSDDDGTKKDYENCIGQELCSQKDQLKLVGELNLSENQKKLLQKYKKKFYLENTKFKSLIENLNSLRKSLHKQTSNLENVVDELRNCFSPHQIMKFLLLVENDKANKFLNPAKLWFKKENKGEDSDYSNFSEFLEEDDDDPELERDLMSRNRQENENLFKNVKENENEEKKPIEKSRKKKHLN